MATISPSCTVWPSATLISLTLPARGASTGISIFIDSSTITGSPAATLSPALVVTWKTTPVMCALISSAIERSLLDHLGMGGAASKVRMREDPPEQGNGRLDPVDHERVEGAGEARDRVATGRARCDDLHQQRIVV